MVLPFPEADDNGDNWRKSARSVNGGACTEVASFNGFVMVRDSVDPHTRVLSYPTGSWETFLGTVRVGRYDAIG